MKIINYFLVQVLLKLLSQQRRIQLPGSAWGTTNDSQPGTVPFDSKVSTHHSAAKLKLRMKTKNTL